MLLTLLYSLQFIDGYSLKWSLPAYLKSIIPKFKHVEAGDHQCCRFQLRESIYRLLQEQNLPEIFYCS